MKMVNAKKIIGYELDGQYLPHNPDSEKKYLVPLCAVRKRIVWKCDYCDSEEGYCDTKEEAENCCLKLSK